MSLTELSTQYSNLMGLVHSVETFGVLDGPGIRYVVFLQGCPLKCIYCHNPDSRVINTGTPKSVEDIIKDVLNYKSFIKKGGITLSGGEPLLQAEFCEGICDAAHLFGINVAIDTSGGVPLGICKGAIDKCDLVLLDIKATDKNIYENLTGDNLAKPIKILKYCEKLGKKVWIRHVLIPNITLKDSAIVELAKFLKEFTCIERVDLLPFHKMGEHKWEAIGEEYTLSDTPATTKEELQRAKELFFGEYDAK